MALLNRLREQRKSGEGQAASGILATAEASRGSAHQELKFRVHNRLFELLDLAKLAKVSEDRIREDISVATCRILEEEKALLTLEERDRIVREIQDEVLGLGPLEPLLQDPSISDIMVNGHTDVYIERHGRLEKTPVRFKDDSHLMRIIEKIVSAVGRRVDEMNPMVDARLADGSRVNAVVPPLTLDGPSISIRRFGTDPLTHLDLVEKDALTEEVVTLLRGIVQARLNVLISGGTGSGKTTLLNVMSGFIPESERIVTIEDSAELQLKQDHVVRLETRPANIEGKGEINQRNLVINSLRMRPDRIVVGEVRGAEALDMLQAMNTGHDGSLTTVHANSPRDALSRIETMIAMAGLELPPRAVRSQIASAIDVVIQLVRLSDGKRKLVGLEEIVVPTGIRPRFADKLRLSGVELPEGIFERSSRNR
jgi:pilus assembly protein CpaF